MDELIVAAGQDAVKIELAMQKLEALCLRTGPSFDRIFAECKARVAWLEPQTNMLNAIQIVYKELAEQL